MAIPNVNKPQTIFPDLPRGPFLDSNGKMNRYWELWFQQLVSTLQTNFKNEGFVIPPLTSSDIVILTGTQSINNMIYDSTTNEFKGNVSGTWKTFILT